MCATCGCSVEGNVSFREPGKQVHDHQHTHGNDHIHSHEGKRTVDIEKDILSANNLLAERNRGYFMAKNILALNLVSSPGSGKTTLLECTLKELNKDFRFYVIEGDQYAHLKIGKFCSNTQFINF